MDNFGGNNFDGRYFGGNKSFFVYPFLSNLQDDDGNKMAHDSYQVYVNGDYVGDKLSITQGDGGWKAIESYLKGRNFDGYRVTRDGNRIYVDVQDEEEAEAIRNHLTVYTQIR
ncbi:MAG: hypothetical protein WBI74_10750 [Caldicoprobacterales bacterium]|jgi:hypothetical protein|nr:hypothetical protein [Clostridiales bacterium]